MSTKGEQPANAFGRYVRDRRVHAGISLRKAADSIGVTHVYLGEVERGVRAPLARGRWPKLVGAIPGISMRDLERHASLSRPMQLELQDLPPAYQNLGLALARRIARQDLEVSKLEKLMELLGGGEEDGERGR